MTDIYYIQFFPPVSEQTNILLQKRHKYNTESGEQINIFFKKHDKLPNLFYIPETILAEYLIIKFIHKIFNNEKYILWKDIVQTIADTNSYGTI